MTQCELPTEIDGLHAIADRYDALICDVWGVLHNGQTPFLATVEALRNFRNSHGPVVLLTNAPRLAHDVELQFDRIGVPRDCYDVLVTSGEGARDELVRHMSKDKPLKLFNLGPDRDRAVRDGLNIVLSEADDAEIVLCTGLFDDETEGPDDYRALLERFRARGLVLLCANPDIVVRRGDNIVYCAGALARAYEEIGGEVKYFGKPHPPVLALAYQNAKNLGAAKKPLVVGDGLETDIKGANVMGWDALFVLGGIHGVEIGDLSSAPAKAKLSALLREIGVNAKWSISNLLW
nr:MAG: TIGR01459 family HAD-type hydrolase [Hyphomicrobiales bacterium]